MVNFNILTGFIVGVIQFFFGLIKILLTYLSILCCIKCKDKCLNDDDNDNNDIEENEPTSPTPLLNNNHNHPILEAYEDKILKDINNNNSNDNNNNKCNI